MVYYRKHQTVRKTATLQITKNLILRGKGYKNKLPLKSM